MERTAREVLASRKATKKPDKQPPERWWERVPRFVWRLFGVLVAIVGFIASASVFVHRISIKLASPPEAHSSFPVDFELVNNNWFWLDDLTRTECRQNVVAFETGRVIVSNPGPGGITVMNSAIKNTKRLRSDEPTTLTCTTLSLFGRPTYADITVNARYRAFFVSRATKRARFLGRWLPTGMWRWQQIPLDDPEIEPDYSTLVPPPPPMPGPSRDAADGITPPK